MSMVGFPLLLIPLAIYNIIAFLMRDVSFAAPLFTLPLTSGTAWPVTLSDVLACARDPAVALRGHQGRASRREISHRSFAVAGRVRRRGCGIRAAAAIRHLDLFPAGFTGAGGFPVGYCIACPARNAGGAGRRGRKARRQKARRRRSPNRFNPIPRRQCRRLPRWPNPCCRITPSRRSRIPASKRRQMHHPHRCRRRNCSRGDGSPRSPDAPPHELR